MKYGILEEPSWMLISHEWYKTPLTALILIFSIILGFLNLVSECLRLSRWFLWKICSSVFFCFYFLRSPIWKCWSILLSNFVLFSSRFWAHLVMSYVCSFWTFYVLYKEYKKVATMRLEFLASECRRPDQFTVNF